MPLKNYSSAARKTQSSFKKTYGSRWKSVYYALANKRTGGFKGKNRGSKAANKAFAKGAHWKGSAKRARSGRRRIRG